jgi:mRNA interferase RelE/StbE
MKFKVELKKRAVKDLRRVPVSDRAKLLDKIESLADDLSGDVKKLTNFTPEYRMRWGNWRVLFEIESETVVVYRVLNRKETYG